MQITVSLCAEFSWAGCCLGVYRLPLRVITVVVYVPLNEGDFNPTMFGVHEQYFQEVLFREEYPIDADHN